MSYFILFSAGKKNLVWPSINFSGNLQSDGHNKFKDGMGMKSTCSPVEALLGRILTDVVIGTHFEFKEAAMIGRKDDGRREELTGHVRSHDGARCESAARRFTGFHGRIVRIPADAALAAVPDPLDLQTEIIRRKLLMISFREKII